MIAIDIPANLLALRMLGPWIQSCLVYSEEQTSDTLAPKLELAIQEIGVNVVRHAYQNQAGHTLRVTYRFDDSSHQFTVIDWGAPFDGSERPNVDPQNPTEGGYGLHIVESLCSDFSYSRLDDANHWTLTVERSEAGTT